MSDEQSQLNRELRNRLLQEGLVEEEKLDQAMAEYQSLSGKSFVQILLQQRLVEMNTVTRLMQQIRREMDSGSEEQNASPTDRTAQAEAEPSSVSTSPSASTTVVRGILGDTFAGHKLLKEIGRGGMGIIYQALQPGVNRVVALKVLLAGAGASETEIRRFEREAQATAQLNHPNIVKVHSVGQEAGYHYFTMDFIEGKTLHDVFGEKLPSRRIARHLEKIARALGEAHDKGIVHRDIKPSNVLINLEDEPFLTDFGLAKVVDARSAVTQSGMVLGTPFYMAPEQALGRIEQIDAQSDIYSLGVVLYEGLTGALPFQAETLAELYRKIVEDDPIPPHELIDRLPPALEAICLKAMAKEKKRRYASAREMANDLKHFLEGKAKIRTTRRGSSFLTRRWLRQWKVALSVIALTVLLTTMAMVGYMLWGRYTEYRDGQMAAQRDRAQKAFQRATACGGEKKWSEALASYREALEAEPKMVEAWLGQAVAQGALGQKENEEQTLAQALKLAPQQAEVVLANARLARARERFSEAQSLLNSLLKKETQCIAGFRLRAEIYAQVGEDQRAAEDLAQIQILEGKQAAETLVLARQRRESNDLSGALAILDELLQVSSPSPQAVATYVDAHLLRGQLLQIQGEKERALYDFTQAVSLLPKVKSYLARGEAQLTLGYLEDARQDFAQALAVAAPGSEALLCRERLADVNLSLCEFNAAYDAYQGLIQDDHRPPALLFHCAQAAYEMKRYDEALELLKSVLAPASLTQELRRDALCIRGMTWRAKGDFTRAIQDLEEALKQTSFPLPLVHSHLGAAFLSLGLEQKAEAHLQQALAQAPQIPLLQETLGHLWLRRKQHRQALACFARCIELVPWEPRFHYLHGTTLYALGQYDEAIGSLHRALELEPENLVATTDLIRAIFDRADLEDVLHITMTFSMYIHQFHRAGVKDLFQDRLEELTRRYGHLAVQLQSADALNKNKPDYQPFLQILRTSDSPAVAQSAYAALVSMVALPEVEAAIEQELQSALNSGQPPAVAMRLRLAQERLAAAKRRRHKDQVRKLVTRLHAGHDRLALPELDRWGSQGIDLLGELAQDTREGLIMRWLASKTLLDLRTPEAMQILLRLMESGDSAGQLLSAVVLREAGFAVAEAPLAQGLKEKEPLLRALATLHLSDPEEVRPSLDDPDERVALYAARRLQQKYPQKAIPVILQGFQSRNPLVRIYSCSALWPKRHVKAIDPVPANWVEQYSETLRAALEDSDARMRRVAATRVGAHLIKKFIPQLVKQVDDSDFAVRYQAVTSLTWIATESGAVAGTAPDLTEEEKQKLLRIFLSASEPLILRVTVMRSLSTPMLGGTEALQQFGVVFQGTDVYFTGVAISSFGTFGGDLAHMLLVPFLGHDQATLRMAAAVGLIAAPAPMALTRLHEMAAETNLKVARAAAAALVCNTTHFELGKLKELHRRLAQQAEPIRQGAAVGYYAPLLLSLNKLLETRDLTEFAEAYPDIYSYYLEELARLDKTQLTRFYPCLTQAIAIYDSPRYRYERALLGERLERLSEAIEDARQSVKMDPRNVRYPILLARLLSKAGQDEEALTVTREIEKLDPRVLPGWRLRGEIYEKRRDDAQAESAYWRLYLLQPAEPGALLSLGRARLKQKQWATAREVFQRAAELAPNQPRPVFYLAALQLAMGDKKAALKRLHEFHKKVNFTQRDLAQVEELQELMSHPWVQKLPQ